MKLTPILQLAAAMSLLASSPVMVSAQRPRFIFPKNALEEASRLANEMNRHFEEASNNILAGLTLSSDITSQLQSFNDFLSRDLMQTLNENRYEPASKTPINPLVPERSCANRKDITDAFAKFFYAAFKARQSIQKAICSTLTAADAAGAATVVVFPVTQQANVQIDLVESNIRKLYSTISFASQGVDGTKTPFSFFYFGCRLSDNPADCKDECPADDSTCSVCPCKWYYNDDGTNPNPKNCPWMSEKRYDFVKGFDYEDNVLEAGGDRATAGWPNLKDCRQCFPNGPLDVQCIAISL